jgi:hypothetical protein
MQQTRISMKYIHLHIIIHKIIFHALIKILYHSKKWCTLRFSVLPLKRSFSDFLSTTENHYFHE